MYDITITPSGAALAAQVEGVDLSQAYSQKTMDMLSTAFTAHSVLVFRDQKLSQADQIRFSRCFGNPVPHPTNTRDRDPHFSKITILSNIKHNNKPIGALGNDEVHFHIDLVFLSTPGSVSVLYCLETPAQGGETTWASGYAAYAALMPETRNMLEGTHAVYRHRRAEYNPPIPAAHPLACVHPVSQRKTLYLSPGSVETIKGLEKRQATELLNTLSTHLNNPQFAWQHRWRPGDLVVWDNRCTLHRREAFAPQARRLMWRTQLLGQPSL